MTVDSRPIGQGPASRISSTRPFSSSATSAAVVGLTAPARLALGAAIGTPAASISARETGWAGARSATVSSPALTRNARGEGSRRFSTSVSAPGQNACTNSAASGLKVTSSSASARSCTWTRRARSRRGRRPSRSERRRGGRRVTGARLRRCRRHRPLRCASREAVSRASVKFMAFFLLRLIQPN